MTFNLDRELALAQLRALVQVPGALKIITNEHACGGGTHPDSPGFDTRVCAAYQHDLYSPRHFVLRDVVALDGPDAQGRYYARSAGGDWTRGYPEALVRRLQEWQQP